MTEEQLDYFLSGTLVLGSAAIATFFLRFWRDTRQFLFLAFAVAFLLLGTNWLILTIVRARDEAHSVLYILRVAAFLVIIVGVWHHNRSGRK